MNYQIIILGLLTVNIVPSDLVIIENYFINRIGEPRSKVFNNQTFDFIIIGSGPTGSVLANRLTENPEWNILLIEAGGIPSIVTDTPGFCAAFQFTGYDWGYRTEQQDGFCRGCYKQNVKFAHGKVLGGSSIINFMINVRGNRRDYDRWAQMGNPGWSYEEVLPYFMKSEDAHIKISDSEYHGKGGYLTISDVPYRTKLVDAMVKGAQEAGYPYVDYNGREQMGVSYVQAHLRNGKRCSAEKAFLRPVADRPNLRILTNSRVVQILIDPYSKKAYGVKFAQKKKYYYAFASKEVILSAGGLNSPQLLMLSGIGPKDHLEELRIPVIKNLPVGKKMYDHPTFLGLLFEINQEIVYVYDKILTNVREMTDFLFKGKGQITSIGGVEGLIYFKSNISTDPDPLYPDMELIILGASLAADNGLLFRKMFNVPDDTYEKIWKKYETVPAYQIMPMLVHPKSVGYIKLKSKNPFHWPKFYVNYFSDPENHDIKTFIAAIREIQRLNRTPAMQKLGAKMVEIPLPGCEQKKFDSDEYWECGLRSMIGSLWHQVAACKMGPKNDPEAVVDNTGKVYGIQRLRVADTSIIPLPPTAHTATPAYMIGEKISDLIKSEWK